MAGPDAPGLELVDRVLQLVDLVLQVGERDGVAEGGEAGEGDELEHHRAELQRCSVCP